MSPSECLPEKRLESPRFHHCCSRVSRVVFSRSAQGSSAECQTSILCRFLSVILIKYDVQGFDVKSLRAFRVIRPLKLVNGVPSK